MKTRISAFLISFLFSLAVFVPSAFAETEEVAEGEAQKVTVEGVLEFDEWTEEDGEEYEAYTITTESGVVYEVEEASYGKVKEFTGKRVRIICMATPVGEDFDIAVEKIEEQKKK